MYKHIKDMLQSGQVIHIEFTKKNGEPRKMNCTTNLDLIPEDAHPSGDRMSYVNEDVVRAYDIDVKGWRAFRVDSVNVLESKEL
tara:strand:- start:667 stop:918 length:252 start_codon:yes stop_codon:yes gene_type:complete